MCYKDTKSKEILAENFPDILKKSKFCPSKLYVKGMELSQDMVGVAMVGTRRPSPSAPLLCDLLVKSLMGTKAVVISGLAPGIDSFCHNAALKYKIPTIAVMGQGLETLISGSRGDLANQILKEGGSLISAFEDQVTAAKWTFPLRNKIIAGLAHATIVVESKIKGGALLTAEHVLKDNRLLLSVPGDFNRETAAGCNALLKTGKAKALFDPSDFALYAGLSTKNDEKNIEFSKRHLNLSKEAQVLWKESSAFTFTLDELQEKFSFKAHLLLAILTELEIAGVVHSNDFIRYHFAKW